jgi:predicted enzyme related to lactoylglutathione lyase
MGNGVMHFEVLGRDPGALREFYARAFGWRVGDDLGGYTMAFPDAGTGINGGIGAAPGDSAGHAIFYVEVDDVQGALERIERLGGRTLLPPQHVPDGPTFALFADPEGHVLGLSKTSGA